MAVEEASAGVCQEIFAAVHGVENHEQLAHAGGEGRFRVFPARTQLGVKVLDDWIGTNRGDHGHIQDAPDLGAQIQRLPCKLPLSRLNGANPGRAVICLRLLRSA